MHFKQCCIHTGAEHGGNLLTFEGENFRKWWKNGILLKKLSWIARLYCLLSTYPLNNRGENIH